MSVADENFFLITEDSIRADTMGNMLQWLPRLVLWRYDIQRLPILSDSDLQSLQLPFQP